MDVPPKVGEAVGVPGVSVGGKKLLGVIVGE